MRLGASLCGNHRWNNLSSFFEVLIASVHGDLYEGDNHGEDHPDVQHFHVGGHWQGLGESKKAATKSIVEKIEKKENSQGGKDKKYGKVDFNNHINIVLDKDP